MDRRKFLSLSGYAGITGIMGNKSFLQAKIKRNYKFDKKISREVLENYLSRAVTYVHLIHPDSIKQRSTDYSKFEDSIRFLINTGTKFIGRATYRWGKESELPRVFKEAAPFVKKVHEADPDIVIQTCAFEIITPDVEKLEIPARVFKIMGMKPEKRHFQYEDIIYKQGAYRTRWGIGGVPDMSRIETKLWFIYLCCNFIDIGIEAIHFGQVRLMDRQDHKKHKHWLDMITRVRQYAQKKARRHIVICDAHIPRGGVITEGNKLLFDFHSFPLRLEEVDAEPYKAVLKMGYMDSLYGKSKGGITPSGWSCEHLPYVVEFDNFGFKNPGKKSPGHYIWGWDEISWFAKQPEKYRNEFLHYAWNWVRKHDKNGYVQMPGSRVITPGSRWYYANTKSKDSPFGYNQEETIKAIWEKDK